MAKQKIKGIWLYAAVAGLLIFLSLFKIFSPLASAVRSFTNPVFKYFYIGASQIRLKYNEQSDRANLNAQVASLTSERNQLIVDNVDLQKTKEENEILREQLGFFARSKFRYVTSNVISRGDLTSATKLPETITIDKGARNGVTVGLAVVSGQGIIVGKVVEVKDEMAKVNLTNNYYCKLAATIFGSNKTNGIVEGELGLTMKMSFIPQSAVIKPGDSVVTSGLEEAIPRGLVIGKVLEVKSDSNAMWQTAVIEPLVSPDDLIIVSVLLP
jgi:rod shape-determining protein MreC